MVGAYFLTYTWLFPVCILQTAFHGSASAKVHISTGFTEAKALCPFMLAEDLPQGLSFQGILIVPLPVMDESIND